MYRPLEPIPKYLLFSGYRQFVCANASETPLQKWLSVVFRSTTIDENAKFNILLEPPKELLYPYW